MLFNSYEFIFLFFPIVAMCFYALRHFGLHRSSHALLIVSSLYFYFKLDAEHIWVLLLSAAVNYLIGSVLVSAVEGNKGYAKPIFVAGVVLNLGVLCFYKYAVFGLGVIGLKIEQIAPPLAISFFTFHQLAYLADIYKGRIKPTNIREYLLFITFFPHLIAGPIIRYGQFAPQLQTPPKEMHIGVGIFFFASGLAKKVVLADNLSLVSDRVFDAFRAGAAVNVVEAWLGLFAYGLQIYFDFAGYAEMAIGLGLIFGIFLPLNFNSPYKSHNIIEFWRRWHITLSQFLRDYLYIPMGGSRHGVGVQVVSLMVTMTLAGLWHGAGWTFILWGAAHGALLVINHLFRRIAPNIVFHKVVGVVVTFTAVMLLWVLFRSADLSTAIAYYHTLFSGANLGVFGAIDKKELLLIGVGLFIVFFLRSTPSIMGYDGTSITKPKKPDFWHGIIAGALFWLSLKMMAGEPSKSFVYFVF